MFTDAQIEQMKGYDIRDLLPAGIELSGKNNLAGACPFCGAGEDRFSINVPKMLWYCGCSCIPKDGGTAIDYVMMRDRLPLSNALCALADEMGIQPLIDRDARKAAAIREHKKAVQTTRPKMQTDTPADLTSLLPTITAANHRLLHPNTREDRAARDALYMRGVTDIEIERYQLGYLPTWANVDGLSVSPKLIIPRFVDGKLCGVNSKTFDPNCKYRFTGKRGMFNGDGIETAENIIVVEGEFDAILLSRFTTAHVITLGGSNHTLSSSEKLSLSFASNIYALFDGDTAGQTGAAKLTAVLGAKRVQSLPIPAGLDITDVWQHDGDNGVIALLPDVLRIPSTIDCTDVWIGKETSIGIVQCVIGDGHFVTTRGELGQRLTL